MAFACVDPQPALHRDPYTIHLDIALQMVVSLFFGGKSNLFQMSKMKNN